VEDACNAAIDAVALGGLGLARVELLDAAQLAAVNVHAKLGLAETPTLFLEFHGTTASLDFDVGQVEAIAREHGAKSFERASSENERRRLWKARHEAYWAIRATARGRDILATDVCVPISRLAFCVAATVQDAERLGLHAPILGHVGDGNFHATPIFDGADRDERARLDEFLDRLVARALACGGTCTGEHGIGQGKRKYLTAEAGAGIGVMRNIKQALDPLGILNPGKVTYSGG
jgi:D-lactate dehydrogenase (cytochrome)